MKDHIREKVALHGDLEYPISELSAHLLRFVPDNAVDARLESEWCGYDGGSEYFIVYWRPMTEKGLEKAKRDRKNAREAKKKQKEAQEAAELEQLQRLAEKYGMRLEE